MLLLGIVGFNPERFAQLIVNILAIGGGFLIGQFLAGFAFWMVNRWLAAGKIPNGFREATKKIGGVVLAVLVAFIVFGHGDGWTLFGGGGTGSQNEAEGEQSGGTPATAPNTPVTAPDPPPTPPDPVRIPDSADLVQITVLGGDDVRDARFYLIDEDKAPRTFAEVRAALLDRKAATDSGLGLLVQFGMTNVLPRTHPAVVMLTQWATDNGVAVTFPGQPPTPGASG